MRLMRLKDHTLEEYCSYRNDHSLRLFHLQLLDSCCRLRLQMRPQCHEVPSVLLYDGVPARRRRGVAWGGKTSMQQGSIVTYCLENEAAGGQAEKPWPTWSQEASVVGGVECYPLPAQLLPRAASPAMDAISSSDSGPSRPTPAAKASPSSSIVIVCIHSSEAPP